MNVSKTNHSAAQAGRSIKPEIRNPLLALPSVEAIMELPPEARKALRNLLMDLRKDAAEKAELSWSKSKGPMAAYWKAVSVYAYHTARVLRDQAPETQSQSFPGAITLPLDI